MVAIIATRIRVVSGITTWYMLRSLRILKGALNVSAAAAAMEMVPLVPGVRGKVPDTPKNLDKLVDLFSKMQSEESDEVLTEAVSENHSWAVAGTWNSITGTTGILILVGYLLWKLY